MVVSAQVTAVNTVYTKCKFGVLRTNSPKQRATLKDAHFAERVMIGNILLKLCWPPPCFRQGPTPANLPTRQ